MGDPWTGIIRGLVLGGAAALGLGVLELSQQQAPHRGSSLLILAPCTTIRNQQVFIIDNLPKCNEMVKSLKTFVLKF